MRDARAMTRTRAGAATFPAILLLLPSLLWAADTARSPLPGLSLYNITSQWTTQDGKPVHLDSLRGRPVVVAMIYLNCPDVCPLIAENMEQIQAGLPKGLASSVDFALFTFDSARDSPVRLKAYASARGLNAKNWTLFQGDEMATRELAAALDVTYRKKEDGTFDHSVVISLLDADGVVVYRQIGLRQDTREFVSKIRKLGIANTK